MYRSYRTHRRKLRHDYPPLDREQRELLEHYGEALKDVAAQLKRPDKRIDVDALNRADAWAKWTAYEYWALRGTSGPR
jgi:hypothetical protein